MQSHIIALIIPTLSLVFAGAFIYLWLRDRSKSYVLGFAIGYASLVASTILNIIYVSNRVPELVPAIHIVSSVGATTIIWGASSRLGLKIPFNAFVAIIAASAGLLWLAARANNANVIVNTQNEAAALLFAIGAIVIWSARSKQFLDRALVWIFALMAAHGFIRPLIALLAEGELSALIGGTSVFSSINVLVLLLLSVLMAIVNALMVLTDYWNEEREVDARDELTGLYRRSVFEKMAQIQAQRALRERSHLCLVVIDIDHFKQINDKHGHPVGDQGLAAFGALISSQIRPADIAGRMGGEEFCILAWDCEDQETRVLAERIRSSVAQMTFGSDKEVLGLTASLGVTDWAPGEPFKQAYDRADKALYQAKQAGRNLVVVNASQGSDSATKEFTAVPQRAD